MPNVGHQVIGNAVSTSGTLAVTALASQGEAVFGHVVLFNPSGSGAGKWSDDDFTNNIFKFPAGPGMTTLFEAGSIRVRIRVKRDGATDLSNVVVAGF